MPSIELPYVNIALDSFGFIVTLIIFSVCLSERISKKRGSRQFVFLLGFVLVTLAADALSWVGEGHPELRTLTLASNTVATCAERLALICFMEYMRKTLYENSRAALGILYIFSFLCIASIAYSIGNAFFEYAFFVNETGHYVHAGDGTMAILQFAFSFMVFFALILMALFAVRSTKVSRFSFVKYVIFPIAGMIFDYFFHGISLTYVGIVISALVIYADIYLASQKMIDAQLNSLMLSQINPHFVYNTLSTIAAMCDKSPALAKGLTIDFSRYLRHNLDTLTNENLISFEKELEHVECYLKIEKTRFREKLNVIYSIGCKDFMIPPLSLQPIVENAVKHGVTQKMSGGTVKIVTYATEENYVVEIIDDGVGFDTAILGDHREGHVGLSNVESRVKRMCRGQINYKSIIDVGTRVTIEIPRRKGIKNEYFGSRR